MIKKNVKVRYLYVIKTYLSSSMIVFFISGIYCLFKFQSMKLIISIHGTQSFNTWNAEFQYMERRVSIHGTQSFNI